MSHQFRQTSGRTSCARCGATDAESWCSLGCVGMRVELPLKFCALKRIPVESTGIVAGALSPEVVLATIPGELFPYPVYVHRVLSLEPATTAELPKQEDYDDARVESTEF